MDNGQVEERSRTMQAEGEGGAGRGIDWKGGVGRKGKVEEGKVT